MSEYIRHNCGIVVAHTLHDVYAMIKSQQHRGREAAGIAAISDERIDVLKWAGKVGAIGRGDLHRMFPSSDYHTFFGHVRYATKGRKDKILEDAHPHVIGGEVDFRGDHVFIHDCDAAIVHNGQVGSQYFTDIDSSKLRTSCDTEGLLHYYFEHGERDLLRNIPAAYTAAIADKRRKEIMVLRDRTGIRLGALCWKDNKFGAASEAIAYTNNGGEFIEELFPGAVYYIDSTGKYERKQVIEPLQRRCFFEFNYMASSKSNIKGVNVNQLRRLLGMELAREMKEQGLLEEIDFVSYVPQCPESAARGFAQVAEIPFLEMFYKKREERSFLGSTEEQREESITRNLYLLPLRNVRKKNVLVIEDSLVRGNVGQRVRELLYEKSGVNKAILASYTPPIGIIGEDNIARGCIDGIDMPPNDSFIARDETGEFNRSLEEIAEVVGMAVHYLSEQGMFKVFNEFSMTRKNMCSWCIGGARPY